MIVLRQRPSRGRVLPLLAVVGLMVLGSSLELLAADAAGWRQGVTAAAEAGDGPSKADLLQRLVEAGEASPAERSYLVETRLQLGDPASARRTLEQWTAAPAPLRARLLAAILVQEGQPAEALAVLAGAGWPDDPASLRVQVAALTAAGRNVAAAEAAGRLADLSGSTGDRLAAARAWLAAGSAEQAVAAFQAAREADPGAVAVVEAAPGLARIESMLPAWKRAGPGLERARLWLEAGRPEQAAAEARTFLAGHPESTAARTLVELSGAPSAGESSDRLAGLTAARLQALLRADRAVAAAPADAARRLTRARLLVECGRAGLAAEDLAVVGKRQPEPPGFAAVATLVAAAQGRPEEARRWLRKALAEGETSRSSLEAMLAVARAEAQADNPAAARHWAARVALARPQWTEAATLRDEAAARMGKTGEDPP